MSEANEVDGVVMCGVREYEEGLQVSICHRNDRVIIESLNEAGWRCTQVDLLDLLKWVSENRPELYMSFVTGTMLRDYT